MEGAPSQAAMVPAPKRAEPARAKAAVQDLLLSLCCCHEDDEEDAAATGVASLRIAKFRAPTDDACDRNDIDVQERANETTHKTQHCQEVSRDVVKTREISRVTMPSRSSDQKLFVLFKTHPCRRQEDHPPRSGQCRIHNSTIRKIQPCYILNYCPRQCKQSSDRKRVRCPCSVPFR